MGLSINSLACRLVWDTVCSRLTGLKSRGSVLPWSPLGGLKSTGFLALRSSTGSSCPLCTTPMCVDFLREDPSLMSDVVHCLHPHQRGPSGRSFRLLIRGLQHHHTGRQAQRNGIRSLQSSLPLGIIQHDVYAGFRPNTWSTCAYCAVSRPEDLPCRIECQDGSR